MNVSAEVRAPSLGAWRRAAKGCSKVRLLGWLLGLAGLGGLDMSVLRENRIVPGQGLSLWESVPLAMALGLLGLWCVQLTGCCSRRPWALLGSFLAVLLFVPSLLAAVGLGAASLLEEAGSAARVSLGPGLWTALFAAFIAASDLYRDQGGLRRFWKAGGLMAFGLLLLAVLASGSLDRLSLMVELSHRQGRFLDQAGNHLGISGLSVGASALLGIPLGFTLSRRPKLRVKVMPALNLIQTIPSLALFGLLIAPLALLADRLPVLEHLGIQGIGWTPAVIALSLYALLPIVHNTSAGFASVGKEALEAGRGMGMSRAQLLLLVELPLALPVLINGLRVASVQNIGNTAVAALIGAGGFGAFIFQGMGQAAADLILLGALPTIAIAVAVDWAWQRLVDLLPAGGGTQ